MILQRISRVPVSVRRAAYSSQPWFVEETPDLSFLGIQKGPEVQEPIHPPAHVPSFLHPLHREMTTSPFIDPRSVSFIDCKAADPDSRLSWVIVSSLKPDRLSGSRGAAERVKAFLKSDRPGLEEGLFYMQEPKVVGTQRSASLNTLRRKTMKRTFLRGDLANDDPNAFSWTMVDATPLNVHVMSPLARDYFDLDELWAKISKGEAIDLD